MSWRPCTWVGGSPTWCRAWQPSSAMTPTVRLPSSGLLQSQLPLTSLSLLLHFPALPELALPLALPSNSPCPCPFPLCPLPLSLSTLSLAPVPCPCPLHSSLALPFCCPQTALVPVPFHCVPSPDPFLFCRPQLLVTAFYTVLVPVPAPAPATAPVPCTAPAPAFRTALALQCSS